MTGIKIFLQLEHVSLLWMNRCYADRFIVLKSIMVLV